MRRNFAIASALLIWVAPALAQVPQQPQQQQPQGAAGPRPVSPELRAARRAVRQACMEDIRTLCSQGSQAGNSQPGGAQSGVPQRTGGAIMMCLRSQSDRVSQGCKEATRHLREVRRGA